MFTVLSDDLTILGVMYNKRFSNYKIIKKEKINDSKQSIMTYYGNSRTVNTFLVDENKDIFMVGDVNGDVIKYNLTNGKMIKHFVDLGISSVISSSRLNNLYVFGGNNFNFTVINNETVSYTHLTLPTTPYV